jgi:TRAP-type C4-dicarboxylate transport system permease small subunit
MGYFADIVRWIGRASAVVAGGFLIAIMLLIVGNIASRSLGGVIAGTFELVKLMIVVTVGLALGYTALRQGHVAIKIVVSRLSQRVQAVLRIFTSALSIGVCAVIAWASIGITHERALLGEQTQIWSIPYLPFRCVWVFGLLFLCLAFLLDMYRELKQAVSQ